MSILKIAESEIVAPSTVSKWLRKVGVEIKQGQHFVTQPSLNYSEVFLKLLMEGPEAVQKRLKKIVWGIQFSEDGLKQHEKFCTFVRMHREGFGVREISQRIEVHRSTVAEWREGSDQPYLVNVGNETVERNLSEGWMLVPLFLESEGNDPMS